MEKIAPAPGCSARPCMQSSARTRIRACARTQDHSPLPHQGDVDAVGSGHSCKGHESTNYRGQVLGEESGVQWLWGPWIGRNSGSIWRAS